MFYMQIQALCLKVFSAQWTWTAACKGVICYIHFWAFFGAIFENFSPFRCLVFTREEGLRFICKFRPCMIEIKSEIRNYLSPMNLNCSMQLCHLLHAFLGLLWSYFWGFLIIQMPCFYEGRGITFYMQIQALYDWNKIRNPKLFESNEPKLQHAIVSSVTWNVWPCLQPRWCLKFTKEKIISSCNGLLL